MTGTRVVAICPVYTPPELTHDRLREIAAQVDAVVVVDDGSPQRASFDGLDVHRFDENRGIAAALNEGLAAARRLGATHVLTIDQDSRFPSDYVRELLDCGDRARRLGMRPGAVGAVEFQGLRHRGRFVDSVMRVAESIQSGTLFDLAALNEIGGFDESLVIDGVDTDACLRLQDAGYDVVAAPVAFEHTLGAGQFVSLFGKQVWSSGHDAFRRYYITRNGLALLRRHGRHHPRWALVYARRLLVATLLAARQPDRRPAISRGISDGLHGRRGQRWLPSPPAVRS